MGLDMYLDRQIYIGANFDHREVDAQIDIRIKGKPITIDPKKLDTITESIAYWRKANQVHAWFVKHVQDGKDECQRSRVTPEQLNDLLNVCRRVRASRDLDSDDETKALVNDLLPPAAGFFFGSTEIGEGYWRDIDDTIKQLEPIVQHAMGESADRDTWVDYYYQSSW